MNSDVRYTPTSPLSPRPPTGHQPRSTQHGRQPPRNMHMSLPRFHPANFNHLDPPATPSSTIQSPAITLNRVTQPVQMESPRLMREKQREFLERAHLSSKIAASSTGIKPGAPRLDPLGSPKGPVTPLTLEDAGDYFQVARAGKASPAASPGPRSPRSDAPSDKEESKKKNVRPTDGHQ
ncbi:uncharacterized protein Z518_03695 [Rhinocladiella mackenziei CBS 650.93]|uniref:Uncharacterized protein n=1 Tax=Rhinocladiella mackenziei CBS 650.93 TaxID=1442369 RepID=A0A0D2H5N8_9EURO|nr:uncharacterized protein Z518_03695 [Rhinocladiella mackenziei CBS 650.93]KIX05723.1 hypothetical protein Z518_03695 [Rhinocladiella mackenziei CBS 650.93]